MFWWCQIETFAKVMLIISNSVYNHILLNLMSTLPPNTINFSTAYQPFYYSLTMTQRRKSKRVHRPSSVHMMLSRVRPTSDWSTFCSSSDRPLLFLLHQKAPAPLAISSDRISSRCNSCRWRWWLVEISFIVGWIYSGDK